MAFSFRTFSACIILDFAVEPQIQDPAPMPPLLTLLALSGRYAVCRLPADAPSPTWAIGEFVSISRTADELSVVCAAECVPAGVRREDGWRCLRVAGVIDFTVVGVLASITAPLAEAGVSAFAVSTFDTDYLLVKEQSWERACQALRQAGLQID
jgi:hypothetical protein